jgi:MFS family permease
VLGGALAQYPVGWLADKFDRRWVLIGLSVAAMVSSAVTLSFGAEGRVGILLSAGLFGLTTYPIFSVAAAHAHDFASNEERVELSAALMFFFAVGAIASPAVTSVLIGRYGPGALFVFLAAAHLILVVVGIARMRARPTQTDRTSYVYTPRTTFLIGRLFGQSRSQKR